MDRRTFHKLMTTAVMGNGIGLMRGQESGISLYGNLERPVLIPKLDSLPKEPLAIGTRKQLFVDRLIVAQTDEVLFTVVAPQKYPGNPIFVPEVPSDGQMISPVAVGWNEQKKLFQLWYDAMHMEMGRDATSWLMPNQRTGFAGAARNSAYASSMALWQITL